MPRHWARCCMTHKPKMEAKAIGDTHGEVKSKALLDTLAYMLA